MKGRTWRPALAALVIAGALVPAQAALAAGPSGGSGLLPNGFTAKLIATSGETIRGAIDASGYDVGVYVGPGVHDVTLNGATVSGANDQGVLVQDTSDVRITRSTVKDNAVAPDPSLPELKGIVLTGTHDVIVTRNLVTGNAHGGIGVYDDGPNSQWAPIPIDSAPRPGADNVVSRNAVLDNPNDCGIVVSAKNPGGGVMDNVVSRNTVTGFDPAAGDNNPAALGGIVIAGGSFGPVPVTDTIVSHNVVRGGQLPGISMHAFGPGVISGTRLIGNLLSDNGAGQISQGTTGIEMYAVAHVGTISGTQVINDVVENDTFGVFHLGDTGTHIVHLTTSGVTDPVAP